MGKKKSAAEADSAPAEGEGPEEKEEAKEEEKEEEDGPVVKELKALDDRYLEIEERFRNAVEELRRKYDEEQAPILAERAEVLAKPAEGEAAGGTPTLKGFWLQALKHHPAFEDQIETWDEPVLEFLSNITKSHITASDPKKGFKLEFHFAENPFFTNSVLWKEYHLVEGSPYAGSPDAQEIAVSTIEWKPGMNITVELVKKKAAGSGKKKASKAAAVKEQPRDSFFRNFFRHLAKGMALPDDINLLEARELCDDSDEDGGGEMMGLLMENDHEIGCAVRDQLIPFAVRWYTGEADPSRGDDSDDDESDDEDDDYDDDDDSEEEDEPPPAKGRKAQAKTRGTGRGGGGGKAVGKGEDCKQQ